mmetsp:Transcript_6341/g.13117  ORF Transcript_6341/g.13117 Transcript_6341/m.13117 type:complete len:219 (-) Transcript_6341:648-1304(-)
MIKLHIPFSGLYLFWYKEGNDGWHSLFAFDVVSLFHCSAIGIHFGCFAALTAEPDYHFQNNPKRFFLVSGSGSTVSGSISFESDADFPNNLNGNIFFGGSGTSSSSGSGSFPVKLFSPASDNCSLGNLSFSKNGAKPAMLFATTSRSCVPCISIRPSCIAASPMRATYLRVSERDCFAICASRKATYLAVASSRKRSVCSLRRLSRMSLRSECSGSRA